MESCFSHMASQVCDSIHTYPCALSDLVAIRSDEYGHVLNMTVQTQWHQFSQLTTHNSEYDLF